MYPSVRVDKLHPDGSSRAAWSGYRLPDVQGWMRVWTPPHTPRVHVRGVWTPAEPLVSVFRIGQAFVPHLYWDPDGLTFYVDVVREVRVGPDAIAYVDLYVDVILHAGVVTTKDEELLERLASDEGRRVLAARDALVARARDGDALFDPSSALWHIPDDARGLPPGRAIALG